MKTVIYNSETKIIKGFADAQIDPIETQKIIKPILESSDEAQNLEIKKSNLGSISLARFQAKFDSDSVFFLCAKRKNMSDRDMAFLLATDPVKAKEKLNAAEVGQLDDCTKRMAQKDEEARELMIDMGADISALKIKEREFIESEAVYFTPHVGEKILTYAEYGILVNKFADLEEGESLDIDGNVIPAPEGE